MLKIIVVVVVALAIVALAYLLVWFILRSREQAMEEAKRQREYEERMFK